MLLRRYSGWAAPSNRSKRQSDAALVPGLAIRGKLIVVGITPDASEVSSSPLVFGGRSIYGSLTGSAIDTHDTLAFSVLQDVRPIIETLPLEKAPEAYARMMDGQARFRMVLVTGKD
jgi:alcohol dehydrogenase, propanol-preferring